MRQNTVPPIFIVFMRLMLYGIGIGLGTILAGSMLGDPWGLVAFCLLIAASIISWEVDK